MSPSRDGRRRTLLWLLVAVAAVATLVLFDVLGTVFFAITVAYVLYPVRQWVYGRGASRRIAAGVATLVAFAALLLVMAPIAGALYVRRGAFIEFVRGLPAQTPVSAFGFEYVIDVSDALTRLQESLTGVAVDVAGTAPVIALKAALFVLLVYALLIRPHDIRAAVMELVPPTYHDVVQAFHERVRSTLYAIYVLQAVTGLATAVVAVPRVPRARRPVPGHARHRGGRAPVRARR